jgi:hypothetical protein
MFKSRLSHLKECSKFSIFGSSKYFGLPGFQKQQYAAFSKIFDKDNAYFEYEKNFDDLSTIRTLEINILGGILKLIPSSSNQFSYRVQSNKFLNGNKSLPELSFNEARDELTLRSSKSLGPFFGKRSIYIMELSVPSKVSINVKMRLGGCLYLDKIENDIAISMLGGTIEGDIHSKNLDIQLGAGSIKLRHLKGNCQSSIKLGETQLSFDDISHRSKIHVQSGFAGDVKIFLPKDTLFSNPVKSAGMIENKIGADIKTEVGLLGNVHVSDNKFQL